MVVPYNDDGGRSIYDTGYYEPVTVGVFEKLTRPGMTVFDIGANIGQYTLIAGRASVLEARCMPLCPTQ